VLTRLRTFARRSYVGSVTIPEGALLAFRSIV
jgi:hypothetical protein